MQAVLMFNRPAIDAKIDLLSRYLGIDGGFEGFYAFVGELNTSLGIPKNLTDLGVHEPDVDAIVEAALRDPSCGGNPVEMTPENTRELLERCL